MTIKDCIDIVDNIKPNQYTIKEKVMWLSFLDEIIINEVLKTHEGYDGRYDDFGGYSDDKISVTLIVPSPYDRLYTAYLKMKIDQENGETARYNNSMVLYNTYMMEYRKHYNKTHMPLDTISRKNAMPMPKASVGLSDAEYENLKKDMTFILTEYFSDSVSADKLTDIVTKFVQNNNEMLKGKDGTNGIDGKDGYTPRKGVDYFDGERGPQGIQGIQGPQGIQGERGFQGERGIQGVTGESGKDGRTPIKGVDYWNDVDKSEISKYIDDKTAVITKDIKSLQQHINNEAHFRGYLSTNAKIQASEATPNDFAYSAESGTKWVYDAVDRWQDTGTPVPDQLTPASDAMPLINGEASAGTATEYARSDHRHPTDTTRVSAEEFDELKFKINTALDAILIIQDTLIGGDGE